MSLHGLLTPCSMSYEAISKKLHLKRSTMEQRQQEAEELPALMEMVSLETARLGILRAQAENAVKASESRAFLKIKDTDGGTADYIKAKVQTDEEVLKTKLALTWAEGMYKAWEGLGWALRAKKDAAEDAGTYMNSGSLGYNKNPR